MRAVRWTLLAVAGLAVAIALTYAAGTLSSQRIGLSSEPLTAGERLVPAQTVTPSASPRPHRTPTPTPTRTAVPTNTATATPAGGDHEAESGDD